MDSRSHASRSRFRQALRGALALAAIAALTATARNTPALADLRIVGRTVHAALWQRIYDQMPDVWKTRRRIEVREVSREEMDRLVAANGDGDANRDDDTVIDGYYQSTDDEDGPGSITLLQSLKGDAVGLVFAHEYAHFVWDTKLTDDQRDDYRQLWIRQRRAGRLVTEYADDSEEEGFAESFSYYLRKPESLRRRDPESWKWIDELSADAVRRTK